MTAAIDGLTRRASWSLAAIFVAVAMTARDPDIDGHRRGVGEAQRILRLVDERVGAGEVRRRLVDEAAVRVQRQRTVRRPGHELGRQDPAVGVVRYRGRL